MTGKDILGAVGIAELVTIFISTKFSPELTNVLAGMI